jgi:transcriptional regulator with XRE-family HTH domain
VSKPLALALVRQLAASGTGRQIRIRAGLSLAEVAEPVGVGRAAISRWERGLQLPTGEPALRWGALLTELDEAVPAS